jgi:hypothetical protein
MRAGAESWRAACLSDTKTRASNTLCGRRLSAGGRLHWAVIWASWASDPIPVVLGRPAALTCARARDGCELNRRRPVQGRLPAGSPGRCQFHGHRLPIVPRERTVLLRIGCRTGAAAAARMRRHAGRCWPSKALTRNASAAVHPHRSGRWVAGTMLAAPNGTPPFTRHASGDETLPAQSRASSARAARAFGIEHDGTGVLRGHFAPSAFRRRGAHLG